MKSALRRSLSTASALVRDLPRFRHALRQGGSAYLALCNRGERLERAPDGQGYRCDWQWTSELRAPKLLPGIGQALMARALSDAPIHFAARPAYETADPQVTFLIGHRGTARLPLLLATLNTIAAQSDVRVECVVVEQDETATLPGRLPPWVRHVHAPTAAGTPYCRSATFNVGHYHARAPFLVLHDNDMLVPHTYARSMLDRAEQGYEVVNLKRFVFYMEERESTRIVAHQRCDPLRPHSVVQNLEAGGSVGITSDGFDCIGGMDESFIGWGGEDNEFWERASTLKVWPWAHLPIVHLWHAPQPNKGDTDHAPLRRYRELSEISPTLRIAQLQQSRER